MQILETACVMMDIIKIIVRVHIVVNHVMSFVISVMDLLIHSAINVSKEDQVGGIKLVLKVVKV